MNRTTRRIAALAIGLTLSFAGPAAADHSTHLVAPVAGTKTHYSPMLRWHKGAAWKDCRALLSRRSTVNRIGRLVYLSGGTGFYESQNAVVDSAEAIYADLEAGPWYWQLHCRRVNAAGEIVGHRYFSARGFTIVPWIDTSIDVMWSDALNDTVTIYTDSSSNYNRINIRFDIYLDGRLIRRTSGTEWMSGGEANDSLWEINARLPGRGGVLKVVTVATGRFGGRSVDSHRVYDW